jgi:hypothetical protein
MMSLLTELGNSYCCGFYNDAAPTALETPAWLPMKGPVEIVRPCPVSLVVPEKAWLRMG